MKKLLGQLLKEDLKSTILWLILPLILVGAGRTLYSATGIDMVLLLVVFAGCIAASGPYIATFILAMNDYHRFYGRNAAFYAALPYTSIAVTIARFLNYCILSPIIILSFFINLLFLLLSSEDMLVFSFADLLTLLNNIDFAMAILLLKILLALFLFFLIGCLNLMMAATLGASNPFYTLGKYAPAFLLGGILCVQTFLLSLSFDFINWINQKNITNVVTKQISDIKIPTFELSPIAYLTLVAILWLMIVLYFAISNYFHKNKISVQ